MGKNSDGKKYHKVNHFYFDYNYDFSFSKKRFHRFVQWKCRIFEWRMKEKFINKCFNRICLTILYKFSSPLIFSLQEYCRMHVFLAADFHLLIYLFLVRAFSFFIYMRLFLSFFVFFLSAISWFHKGNNSIKSAKK